VMTVAGAIGLALVPEKAESMLPAWTDAAAP
jgi:hypothetical protein